MCFLFYFFGGGRGGRDPPCRDDVCFNLLFGARAVFSSFDNSPDPAFPRSAKASLTKGPNSIVIGNTNARIKSETRESTLVHLVVSATAYQQIDVGKLNSF